MPVELVPAFQRRIVGARLEMGLPMPGYGLRTLEACRLEGGFVVAGWDFSTELDPQPGFERTPYEASLGWMVNLDAAEFVGRDALIAQQDNGPGFYSRRFESTQRVKIEDGESVFSEIEGETIEIGFVACSSWSWGLGRMIGHASIQAEYKDTEHAWLQLNGERVPVSLGDGAFINLEQRNQVPAPLSSWQ